MIIAALPKKWKQLIAKNQNCEAGFIDTDDNEYSNIMSEGKLTKYYYNKLNSSSTRIEALAAKWSAYLKMQIDNELMVTMINEIYQVTNFPKYRSFQYRLVSGVLVFNKHLKCWKIKESDICSNCSACIEDTLHFFAECKFVKKLWIELAQYVLQQYDCRAQINPFNIIFNHIDNKKNSVVNLICLMTKAQLYTD